MGAGVAAVVAVLLTVTPANGGLLSSPQIIVNNQAGDQFDPHVDQDLAAYSNAVDVGGNLVQEIRYYAFSIDKDKAVPNLLPDGTRANDLLSDVDQGRIVFTRILPDRNAIMLFDSATSVTTELGQAPGTNRIGVALGSQTVAFIDYAAAGDGSGEIMVLDLATSVISRLTNDAVYDANPAVSPDGNVVTWERCATFSNCDVYRAARSGSIWIIQSLTSSTLNERSPDTNGAQVVFERDDATGPTGSNVVVIPVSGGAETVLEIEGEQYNPSIRGQLVAFESRVGAGNSDIFLADLATNRLFQITDTAAISESLNDVTLLSTGEVRLVWQANDELDPTLHNIYGATFSLPALPSPDAGTPPDAGTGTGCLNRSVAIEATRFYSPTRSVDGQASFSPSMSFAIPGAIPVIAGNSGNKKVTLTIDLGMTTVQCEYRGGSSQAHPTSAAQLALASRYVLSRCKAGHRAWGGREDDDDDDDDDHHGEGHGHGDDHGEGHGHGDDDHCEGHGHASAPAYGAGTVVTAQSVKLHVQNGDTRQPLTRVRLVLGEVCSGTSTVSSPLEAGNPIDGPQAAGCSSSGASLAPFFAAFAFVALLLRRPASIRLVARREQRRLPR